MGTLAPSGVEFLINTTTSDAQSTPAIAALSDGRFVVAWTDSSATGSDTSGAALRAQIFNADGSKFGSEFLVNTTTTGDQDTPTITALANGNFVIAFEDGPFNSGNVRARLFDADGNAIASDFLVNTATTGLQDVPKIAALAGGGFRDAPGHRLVIGDAHNQAPLAAHQT